MKYFSAPLKSVKSYVLVVFSVVGILFAVLLFVMSKQVLYHVSRNYLATAADSMADSILINNYNDFLNYNYYNLRLNLDKLFAYESVEHIYVLDKTNQPVYERSKKYGINFRDLLQANAEGQRQLDASVVTTVKLLQTDNGYQFGRLIIGLNDKAIAQTIERYQYSYIAFLLLVYVAALLVIWILLQTVTRSLEKLKDEIQHVDNLEYPLHVEGSSKQSFKEISQLRLSYQKMLTRLFGYKEKVKEQSRMVAIGNLTNQVIHDLSGPLHSINVARDYLIKMKTDDPYFADHMKLLELGANRLNRVASDLLDQNKNVASQKESFLLQDVVQQLEHEYQLQCKDLLLKTALPTKPITLHGSQIALQRAFANIIKNAVEAMEGKGEIEVAAEPRDADVHIFISDNGPGMSEATLQKILHGGHSEGKSNGHGIGMKVVRETVEDFGGTLSATSVLGVGTKFSITLPLAAS